MGVKLGLSHYGKSVDWGCLRTGFYGQYLDQRGEWRKFRIVFWDVLPCKIIVDNYFTRKYIPEYNSELHTRRRENLKSQNGGSCTTMNFIFYIPPQISLGRSSQGDWAGRDIWHAWERRGMCKRFCWEGQKERDRLGDQGVYGRMGSEWILGRLAGGV
jgi:hypothetical protein